MDVAALSTRTRFLLKRNAATDSKSSRRRSPISPTSGHGLASWCANGFVVVSLGAVAGGCCCSLVADLAKRGKTGCCFGEAFTVVVANGEDGVAAAEAAVAAVVVVATRLFLDAVESSVSMSEGERDRVGVVEAEEAADAEAAAAAPSNLLSLS